MPRLADQSLHLPFAIPAKEWFSPREAALVLGLSERFIEKIYDEGRQLSGHSHNGATGARMTKRIPRIWILSYLLRTAEYDDASLIDALCISAPRLSPTACLQVADRFRKAAHR